MRRYFFALTNQLRARRIHISASPDRKKEYFARKLVGFSMCEMFDVVADVKNYKQFVPFCNESTILVEKTDELHANLKIGFSPIVENYTSVVTLEKPRLVQAICKDGHLFNYLETSWKFSPGLKSNPRSCIIDFYIRFEFASMLHSQIATLFFDRLVQEMEKAFINEVRRRHGKESIPTYVLSHVR